MIINLLIGLTTGILFRLISSIGVTIYLKVYKSVTEVKKHRGFYLLILLYVIGTILKYLGITLSLAFLIKEYVL